MKRAFERHRSSHAEARHQLASWYTPGLSDGLGDRLLMFDNSSASSLELLRFKREFAATPGFETALRQRVDRLHEFRHPSFAKIRAVDWLAGGGLALISNYTEGRRLSDIIESVRGPKFAIGLIKQLTPVLATLQQQGDGIAHGVLTAERIIVTPEGHLVIAEHVLGSALQCLYLPESRLQTELGLAIPISSSGVVRLDGRNDILQLGFIALSLLLGRRLAPTEYPQNTKRLLEELAKVGGSSLFAAPLLMWLERALRMNGRRFDSAAEAQAALKEFPDDPEAGATNRSDGVLAFTPAEQAKPLPPGMEFPRIADPDFQPREPLPTLAVIAREPPFVPHIRLDIQPRSSAARQPLPPTPISELEPVAPRDAFLDALLDESLSRNETAGPSPLAVAEVATETQEKPINAADSHEKPVSAADLHEEPVVVADLHEEPVITADLQEEPVITADLHEEPVIAADLHEEPVITGRHEEPLVNGDPHEEPAIGQLHEGSVGMGQVSSSEAEVDFLPETGAPTIFEYRPANMVSSSTIEEVPPANGAAHDELPGAIAPLADSEYERGVAKLMKQFQRLPADSIRWIAAAVAVVAIAEGVVIAGLLVMRPTAVPAPGIVGSSGSGAGVAVDNPRAGLGAPKGAANVAKATDQKPAPTPDRRDVHAQATPTAGRTVPLPERTGRIRLTSPIELQIFDNGRMVGSSSAGALSMPVGRHELEVVNETYGYRSRQVVDVRAGQVASLAITPPNGRVSINALPWAEVWIDGNPVGETPLGNVAVPLGEHEIVFRHPQLGEKRQTAIVKSDVLTRVSATFQH